MFYVAINVWETAKNMAISRYLCQTRNGSICFIVACVCTDHVTTSQNKHVKLWCYICSITFILCSSLNFFFSNTELPFYTRTNVVYMNLCVNV